MRHEPLKQAACCYGFGPLIPPCNHRLHDGSPGTERDVPCRDVVGFPSEGALTTDESSLADPVGLIDVATCGTCPAGAPRIDGDARHAGYARLVLQEASKLLLKEWLGAPFFERRSELEEWLADYASQVERAVKRVEQHWCRKCGGCTVSLSCCARSCECEDSPLIS